MKNGMTVRELRDLAIKLAEEGCTEAAACVLELAKLKETKQLRELANLKAVR